MSSGQGALTWLTRACVWVAVPALLFMQLFVTFRGLASPLGMEQAQLARELARGRGFHTLTVRPYAWRQMLDHGKTGAPLEMRDTFTPPLQALLLAPVFRAFEPFWEFDTSMNVYFMDRVVAAMGLLFFLGAAGMAWLTARRLFDERIAGWVFVMILACQFLWDVARSGLPQMMALFFFSVALDQFMLALQGEAAGRGSAGRALIMGLSGALVVMSHWMGVWLVLGLACAAAWHLRPRPGPALLVLAPSILALAAWGMRNQALCGDVFGSAKGTLQATLVYASDSWLLRDFSGNSPAAAAGFLVKKLMLNFTTQLGDLFIHLGTLLPAALFFIALFHPFRRLEVRAFGWSLGIIWLFAAIGMALTGLPLKEKDANQVHSLFIPAMTAFGFAFLAVLWGRLGIGHARAGWWSRHGLAAAAFAVSALPMITSLPTELILGFANKAGLAHWPPYMPRQIHKVASFTKPDEIILTDIPWAVAWYADRPAVWLPVERKQFDEMRTLTGEQNLSIAGLLMSPESSRAVRAAEVFGGEYREWARPAFRGIVAAFGLDTMAQTDLPYREWIPLAGQPANEPGRFIAEMTFMSDRKRWETPGDGASAKRHADATSSKGQDHAN